MRPHAYGLWCCSMESPSSHRRKVLQQLAVVSPVAVSTYPNYLRGVDIIYNYPGVDIIYNYPHRSHHCCSHVNTHSSAPAPGDPQHGDNCQQRHLAFIIIHSVSGVTHTLDTSTTTT